MSDDDIPPLDPQAYITSHAYIHHRPTDARKAILDLIRERDEARAEVERQAKHIEELQAKIDAEMSCGCSYDAPGDVCSWHSPALAKAQAEVEWLEAEVERLKLEPGLLRADLISLCNASRNALGKAYHRARITTARGARDALEDGR